MSFLFPINMHSGMALLALTVSLMLLFSGITHVTDQRSTNKDDRALRSDFFLGSFLFCFSPQHGACLGGAAFFWFSIFTPPPIYSFRFIFHQCVFRALKYIFPSINPQAWPCLRNGYNIDRLACKKNNLFSKIKAGHVKQQPQNSRPIDTGFFISYQ
jgi:hypothetical protein